MAIKSVLDPDMPFASEGREKRLGAELPQEYHAWKAKPSPQTSAAFLKSISPVLDTAMTSYGRGGSPTLRSRAKLMALQAAGSFDPQKGNLRTHLLSNLRGLQRAAAQQDQIISLPERVAIERNQLIEAENRLRDELGRDASDSEIADSLGLSTKRLTYLRKAKPATAEGTLTQSDAEGNLRTPATTPLSSPAADAWADFVYYDLSPTDQLIMDYALGRNGAPRLSVNEVAERLHLTPGAISQRSARIQAMLDEQYDLLGG